jgi:hypothetical protein
VLRGFVRSPTARAQFQACILDRGFAKASITERKEIIDEFKMLSAMRWSKALKVVPKSIKINGVPRPVIPSISALDVVSVVVAVDVKANRVVVLTGNRGAIYVN